MENTNLESFLREQTERLTDLDLGLSAHLIQGWRGQFDRVRRFYQRFVDAENAQDAAAALDSALAFFVFAHALREWLSKWERQDGSAFNDSWNAFMADKPEMRFVRDIANATKHLTLSQRESVDKNFSLIWTYDPFDRKQSGWVIYFDERRMRFGDLIRQILNGWEQFLDELNLDS